MTAVRSVKEALKAITRGETVEAVGIVGRIRAWKLGPRSYHATFEKFRLTGSETTAVSFDRYSDLDAWLRQCWQGIKGKDPRGDGRRNAGPVSYKDRRRLYAPKVRARY